MLIGNAIVGELIDNASNVLYQEYDNSFLINYNSFNKSYHFYNSYNNSISLNYSALNIANKINLVPEMIVNGYKVLGINGNFTGVDVSEVTAQPKDVLAGKNYIDNTGNLVSGTMNNLGQLEYYSSLTQQNIPEGFINGGIIHGVTSGIDSNITPQNIKSGTTILGIIGNYEGNGGEGNFVMMPRSKI